MIDVQHSCYLEFQSLFFPIYHGSDPGHHLHAAQRGADRHEQMFPMPCCICHGRIRTEITTSAVLSSWEYNSLFIPFVELCQVDMPDCCFVWHILMTRCCSVLRVLKRHSLPLKNIRGIESISRITPVKRNCCYNFNFNYYNGLALKHKNCEQKYRKKCPAKWDFILSGKTESKIETSQMTTVADLCPDLDEIMFFE